MIQVVRTLLFMLAMVGPSLLDGATNPTDWVVGDVFVATGSGSYQVWHSANPTATNPTYTNVQTINDDLAGVTAGCAFDSAYRLFATNFTNTKVDQYSIDFTHGLARQVSTGIGSPGSTHPESIVFDGHGNFFVGHADNAPSGFGNGKIEKWSLDTNPTSGTFGTYQLENTFTVPIENRGADWIDLASDGQTIFYTSEGRKILKFNVETSHASIFADLGNPGLPNNTLFALRLLPAADADASGGILVADKKNIKLVKVINGSVSIVKSYDAPGQDYWEVLNLDTRVDSQNNPVSFWAGDATTHKFYRFNIASGNIEVGPINTGSNLGGICVDGALSAAQRAFAPLPSTQTFALTPTSNTVFFTSPFTGAKLTATLKDLQSPVSVTVRASLVDPAVAQSDPTVFSFNPGSIVRSFSGNIPCDQTLTTLHSPSYPGTCEVFAFEAEPNDGFTTTNLAIDKPANLVESTPNLRLLRNLDEDITTGVVDYPTSGTRTKCVFTVNQQTFTNGAQSCGFSSPASGQNFNKNQTSSIPFKFRAVAPGGDCQHGPYLTGSDIVPLLLITQLVPNAAPNSIPVIVAGGSGGPPVFIFSGNTWQLQVKTLDMPPGFIYVATVIDLKNVMPSFSGTFSLN